MRMIIFLITSLLSLVNCNLKKHKHHDHVKVIQYIPFRFDEFKTFHTTTNTYTLEPKTFPIASQKVWTSHDKDGNEILVKIISPFIAPPSLDKILSQPLPKYLKSYSSDYDNYKLDTPENSKTTKSLDEEFKTEGGSQVRVAVDSADVNSNEVQPPGPVVVNDEGNVNISDEGSGEDLAQSWETTSSDESSLADEATKTSSSGKSSPTIPQTIPEKKQYDKSFLSNIKPWMLSSHLREVEILKFLGLLIDHEVIARKMELLYIPLWKAPGIRLKDYLLKYSSTLNRGMILHIFEQVIAEIVILHDKGIVHNDIHLENIIITEEEEPTIYLIDYGYSKFYFDEEKPEYQFWMDFLESESDMAAHLEPYILKSISFDKKDLEGDIEDFRTSYLKGLRYEGKQTFPWENEFKPNPLG